MHSCLFYFFILLYDVCFCSFCRSIVKSTGNKCRIYLNTESQRTKEIIKNAALFIQLFFLGFIPCLEICEYICVFLLFCHFPYLFAWFFFCACFTFLSVHVFVFVCHFSGSSKSCSVWRKERNQVIATNNFFTKMARFFCLLFFLYLLKRYFERKWNSQKMKNKNKIHNRGWVFGREKKYCFCFVAVAMQLKHFGKWK